MRAFTKPQEHKLLCSVLTPECDVLEIGSYDGASALAMAEKAGRVYCVDPFLEDKAVQERINPSLGEFLRNTVHKKNIHLLHGADYDILEKLLFQSFRLVFVDGSHSFEATLYDLYFASRLTQKYVAVHDVQWPSVKDAISRWLDHPTVKMDIVNATPDLTLWQKS